MLKTKKNKDVQKCVRMTQDTYDYIMTFEGEGFNAKFDNACKLFAHELERLDIQISSRRRELERLEQKIYSMTMLSNNLRRINDYVQYAVEIISSDMPQLFDSDAYK